MPGFAMSLSLIPSPKEREAKLQFYHSALALTNHYHNLVQHFIADDVVEQNAWLCNTVPPLLLRRRGEGEGALNFYFFPFSFCEIIPSGKC